MTEQELLDEIEILKDALIHERGLSAYWRNRYFDVMEENDELEAENGALEVELEDALDNVRHSW